METRRLVSIKKIDNITPIEGADKIICAHIGGWTVVIGKDEFEIGQEVLYFEVDSMLPLDREEFAFLMTRGKTEQNGKLYHRLRTIKLRGQISQGLVLSLEALGKVSAHDISNPTEMFAKIDEDPQYLSNLFGVIKYEPKLPANLSGKVKNWPADIEHTDEERIQNLKGLFEQIKDNPDDWYATEKIDGTSCTIWADGRKEELTYGVCSRNWGLEEDDENDYWKIAKTKLLTLNSPADWTPDQQTIKKSVLEYVKSIAKCRESLIVVQGELFGEGIQKNPLGIKGKDFRIFNVVVNGERMSLQGCLDDGVLQPFTTHWVPIHYRINLPNTLDEVVAQPDGVKTLVKGANKDAQIEGFVWRHRTQSVINVKKDREPDYSKIPEEKWDLVKKTSEQPLKASFKVISNKYLLKHEG